ncbi:hypothetical protein ILUMI_00630 [Ignelater luminosus]|uniref:Uncharacterized protein n=1 Tax=Ignelater luminosus TaxID=2038154 RepID=A0A8K0DSA0_IGNLU|nr:hypothetical protein ILUMI_00630 [Ignelater luminosus]
MDNTKHTLYKLAKHQARLENEYERLQQLVRMKSKMETLNMIKRCFKIIGDITTVTFSENILENLKTNEKYLEIESKNASHLQNFKEQVSQLFAVQDGMDGVEFPDDLENQLQEAKIEIRKHKNQMKEYFKLVNNCDAIFKENNLEVSLSNESG